MSNSVDEHTDESPRNNTTDSDDVRPRVSGRISIDLTPDEMADVMELAYERNDSYRRGKTTDTNYTSGSGQGIHVRGLTAEFALSLLYEEAEVDTAIYEQGDDGVDCQLRIDGELYDVDVKSSSYRNAWLLVKQGYNHEEADVYVTTYVDDNHVELVGFAWADELIQEKNLEPSPSKYSNHKNYTQKSGFEPMPVPDLDDERVSYTL